MIIYNYNKITGELQGYAPANLDPLETIQQGKEVYAVPPFYTTLIPPQPKEGYTIIFKDGKWEQVEDHRGLTLFHKKTGAPLTITELGSLPKDYVEEKPITLEDLRTEKIKEINMVVGKARIERSKVGKIEGSAETWFELSKYLSAFGDFTSINIVQNDEDIRVTKDELEEAIKYFYIKSMLIPVKRKELLKEINSCKSKKKLQEFIPVVDLTKDLKKLMKLSTEELNKELNK